jgi:hypothetical protein
MDLVVNRGRLIAQTSGRPIVYIARVPIDAPPPEADARQRMNELMPAFRDICSSYHVVLEGAGFVSAVKRSILAGLMQFGWPRNTFYVHATPKEVVFKVDKERRRDAEAVLRMAERDGLLEASGPIDPELSHVARSIPAAAERAHSPRP